MPHLRLPPLPPIQSWRALFPNKVAGGMYQLPRATQAGSILFREVRERVSVANPALCDRFVRELGIREGEVVLEAYPGVGQLTRSLLAGGLNETTRADWAAVEDEAPGAKIDDIDNVQKYLKNMFRSKSTKRSTPIPVEPEFPSWSMADVGEPKVPRLTSVERKAVRTPKLVVATDSHHISMSRGLGFNMGLTTEVQERVLPPDQVMERVQHGVLCRSHIQPNLVFGTSSVYFWNWLPEILSSPLVFPSLEVYDKDKTGLEATKRPWSAPPPPITLVAQLPTGALGDQLINQWISTAIGSEEYSRSWIWEWGRVRIALLASKSTYDRLLAQPGETIHGKLTVMANALFHIRPLPPYHHVPDVDKRSERSGPKVEKARPTGRPKRLGSESTAAPSPVDEITPTRVMDFYRWTNPGGGGRPAELKENRALERPPLLGIELIPRADSPIRPEQREMWEFVLRKCFMRETATIADAVTKTAFGAENLLPRLVDRSATFEGQAVDLDKVVRNLTLPEWHRVVDVFDKWAFKPDNLAADIMVMEDNREIGISM